jgi:hypothetical protein
MMCRGGETTPCAGNLRIPAITGAARYPLCRSASAKERGSEDLRASSGAAVARLPSCREPGGKLFKASTSLVKPETVEDKFVHF